MNALLAKPSVSSSPWLYIQSEALQDIAFPPPPGGIEFRSGIRVGADVTVNSLFDVGFDAVFLGHGAGDGNRLGINGEELDGVYGASEFLIRLNASPDDLPPFLRQPLRHKAELIHAMNPIWARRLARDDEGQTLCEV